GSERLPRTAQARMAARRRAAPVLVLAVAVALGCSDDDDRVSTADEPVGAGPSNVGFPAIDRNEAGVLLVEGSPVGRAALLDATGEEQWEEPLPFDAPIGFPSVAVLPDGRFFVAGVSCSSTDERSDAGPECLPGSLRAAVLDTA